MSTINRLKELESKASPAPWTWRLGDSSDQFFYGVTTEDQNGLKTILTGNHNFREQAKSDEKLCAALRNAAPALLAIAEAAKDTAEQHRIDAVAMGFNRCGCPWCAKTRHQLAALEDAR